MGVVYQVAGVTITKDLIFGWVIHLQNEWYQISDLNISILRSLQPWLHPAWIPDELRDLVYKTLKEKELLNERLTQTDGTYTKAEPKVVTSREKDAADLKDQLIRKFGKPIEALEIGDSADLGYVRLEVDSISSNGPTFAFKNKNSGLSGELNTPVTFKTAIDLILRIWW